MTPFFNFIRKLVRFALALAFWLHALFFLYVPHVSPVAWRTKLHLEAGEAWIIFLIASFSVLLSYGIGKFSVDLAYIYFFPFIAPVTVPIVVFKTIRHVRRTLGFGKPNVLATTATQTVTPPSTPTAIVAAQPQAARKRGIFREILRPFRQFTLLWCLLVLLSTNKWILLVALFIVLLHLVRLLVVASLLTIVSVKWLAQLETRNKDYAEGLIAKVLAISLDGDITQELKTSILGLFSLRAAVKLIRNRVVLVQIAGILGAFVFGVVYIYLALVFGFTYYGLARVQSIPYSWTQAFISSLFIPVSFGDLPRNPWIKLVGGFHWFFVIVLGVGTILGYFQKKLNTLRNTADYLSDRLDEQAIRTHLDVLLVKAQPPKPAQKMA